jgi:hypothetical protein
MNGRGRTLRLATLAVLLASSLVARAETTIQKSGPQEWPGKFQVGFHPFGVQVRFDGLSTGGYHMDMDFSFRFLTLDKVALWAGAGFNWTHPSYSCGFNPTGCAYDLQLWGFLMFTFEKLMRIPLVPFAQAGVGVDILPYPTPTAGTQTGGALAFRIGGGVHYWIVKNVGLGAETHFAVGPGFYPSIALGTAPSGTNVSSYGNWDFVLGARAAF